MVMSKITNLSKNILDIMAQLSKNKGLANLLTHSVSNPFDDSLPQIVGKRLIDPSSDCCCIFAHPFEAEATIDDASFIRVYYNQGSFNENETIQEMTLHIDIIVAKSLWLINDGTNSLIRPYEIMDRIVDQVGRNSVNSPIKIKFDGWQHLAVNTKYDAIRLYCDYFSVETNFYSYEEK